MLIIMTRLFYVLFVFCLLNTLTACIPSPNEAKSQILERGFQYNMQGLIRSIEENDRSITIRFLLADLERVFFKEALFYYAACQHTTQEKDCLNKLRFVISNDIPVNTLDSYGHTVIWHAAINAKRIIFDYVIRSDVRIQDIKIIDKLREIQNNEFDQKKRKTRDGIIFFIQALWNLEKASPKATTTPND